MIRNRIILVAVFAVSYSSSLSASHMFLVPSRYAIAQHTLLAKFSVAVLRAQSAYSRMSLEVATAHPLVIVIGGIAVGTLLCGALVYSVVRTVRARKHAQQESQAFQSVPSQMSPHSDRDHDFDVPQSLISPTNSSAYSRVSQADICIIRPADPTDFKILQCYDRIAVVQRLNGKLRYFVSKLVSGSVETKPYDSKPNLITGDLPLRFVSPRPAWNTENEFLYVWQRKGTQDFYYGSENKPNLNQSLSNSAVAQTV